MSFPNQPAGAPYGAPYGAPVGGDHPEGTKILVLSIIGMLCCGPLAIYTLIQSSNILKQNTPYSTSKLQTAKILSIIGIVLWVIGFIANLALTLSGVKA